MQQSEVWMSHKFKLTTLATRCESFTRLLGCALRMFALPKALRVSRNTCTTIIMLHLLIINHWMLDCQ